MYNSLIVNFFSYFQFLFYFNLGCGEFLADVWLKYVFNFREKKLGGLWLISLKRAANRL